MSFKFKGINKVKVNVTKRASKVTNALKQAMLMEGNIIMNTSQAIVPRDTGWLASSKYVGLKRIAGGVTIVIEYRADYAWFVHEINKNYELGRWKYLEDPLKKAMNGFNIRVAQRAKEIAGK